MLAPRRTVPLAFLVFVLTACGTPSAPSATDLQATIDAQVQATIAAQAAALPTATIPPPTATVRPTNTVEPTRAPTDTPRPTNTPEPPTATACRQPLPQHQSLLLRHRSHPRPRLSHQRQPRKFKHAPICHRHQQAACNKRLWRGWLTATRSKYR